MSENLPPDRKPADPAVPADAPKKPRKRKRRWLWRALIVLPILLVAFVLLLPTLLSLGPVRSMALSVAGPKIAPNGKVQIDSWSFGWLGGQRINGITILDDQNAAVAHLNVETGATLLGLARGDLNLGDTKVTGDFDVRIDPATGRVNLLHVLGADAKKSEPTSPAPRPKDERKPDESPRPQPTKAEPVTIPDVKGKVSLSLTGTVSSTDPRDKTIPLTKIQKADVVVDLTDVEKGIGLDGTIAASIDGKPARILIKGTAGAIENHVLVTDPSKLSADLTATVEQLDLALVNVALAASKVEGVDVAGLLNGKIVVKAVPGGDATIAGDALGIDNLNVVAPQLKGDTLAMRRVDFPLNVGYAASTGQITLTSAGVKSDLVTADVSGALPWSVVENLINKQPPGGTGKLAVKTDAPSFAAIAKMLPHTLALGEGVAVTGGGLTNTLTLDIQPDAAKATTALKLDASGTSNGQPIRLEPTTLNAGATVALPAGVTPGVKQVRDVSIDLAAPFGKITGGGAPTKMRVEGDLDLSRAYADATQFVKLENLDLKGKLGFALQTSGDPTNLTDPLGVKLGFSAANLTFTQSGKAILQNDTITGDVRALYKQTAVNHVVTVEALKIKSDTGLIEAWIGDRPAWFAFPIATAKPGDPARTIGGEGEFHVRTGQLARLAETFAAKDADPSTKLKRGAFDSVITFGAEPGGTTYAAQLKGDLTKLDVGDLLKNESVSLTADARLPADATAVKAAFAIGSNFANVKGIADAQIAGPERLDAGGKPIPLSLFEQVRSVTADGDVPSLAKLYGLATSISPPAPLMDPKTNQPLPPMRVESGSASFKLALARDDAKQLTSVRLDVPAVSDLRVTRGANAYAPEKPITLAFNADLTTDAPRSADATVTSMIQKAVANLALQVPGLATVTTTTPIELTGLDQPTPTAKGQLLARASVGPLGKLLAVVSGGEPIPLEASLVSKQTIASSGDGVTLVGDGQLTDITPTGPDAQPLPERLRSINLDNDLAYDLAKKTAVLKKLTVVAPQARDVLALDAAGTVREVGTRNAFDKLAANVSYDLPNLWPLVQPFVDPTGQNIGKIDRLEGKYTKTFNVGGSYPTVASDGKPILFNEAIRYTVVNGDLQIDRLSLADKGVDVADFALPISLKDGVLTIAYANGSLPKPFGINTGRGDFGGLAVILTGAEPILADVENKKLVSGATLNPVLSNALGKYFNPIFPNATKANAKIEVTLTARGLHLGQSLKTKDSGYAKVLLSLLNLEIANPLGDQLLGGIVNQVAKYTGEKGIDTKSLTNLQGELRDATFTLDRGVVNQNVTFMLGNEAAEGAKSEPKRYAFGFAGDLRLSDLSMNMNASFPMALLKDKLRGDAGDILQYAPDNVPLGLSGTTTAPRVNWDRALPAIGEALLKGQALSRLGALGGKDKKSNDAAADDGSAKKKSDLETIIGAIGDLADKDKKKDRDADAKQADAKRQDDRKDDNKKDDNKKDDGKKKKKKPDDDDRR